MRELLEAFRLPGEAQQIDRIAQAFAEWYYKSEPGMDTCCPTLLFNTHR